MQRPPSSGFHLSCFAIKCMPRVLRFLHPASYRPSASSALYPDQIIHSRLYLSTTYSDDKWRTTRPRTSLCSRKSHGRSAGRLHVRSRGTSSGSRPSASTRVSSSQGSSASRCRPRRRRQSSTAGTSPSRSASSTFPGGPSSAGGRPSVSRSRCTDTPRRTSRISSRSELCSTARTKRSWPSRAGRARAGCSSGPGTITPRAGWRSQPSRARLLRARSPEPSRSSSATPRSRSRRSARTAHGPHATCTLATSASSRSITTAASGCPCLRLTRCDSESLLLYLSSPGLLRPTCSLYRLPLP